LYTKIEYYLPPPIPFSVTGLALLFGEINSATLDAKLTISESSPWSLLSEASSGAALAMDIILANATITRVEKEQTDDWYTASCSLGLLGIIGRIQLAVVGEFKISADQGMCVFSGEWTLLIIQALKCSIRLYEDTVFNGDIIGMIEPYPTANFWWWPGIKKQRAKRERTVLPRLDGRVDQNNDKTERDARRCCIESREPRLGLKRQREEDAIDEVVEQIYRS
jgi:hypothetical protein